MFMPCMDQNSARSAELSHCVAAPVVWNALPCLVDSSLSPPNIHQSRTIQSWSSSTKPTTPSKNIFILKVYFTVLRTYLLTYLLSILTAKRSGRLEAERARELNERERAERGLKKYGGAGAEGRVSGGYERGVSGNFNRSRSAHMLWLQLSAAQNIQNIQSKASGLSGEMRSW